MKPIAAILALSALMAACAHHRDTRDREYSCRAPISPQAAPPVLGKPLSSGVLEVKPVGSQTGALATRHLSLHAEGVPLSLLAPRIGSAMGVQVVVSERALDYVVSAHFDDVSVEVLIRAWERILRLHIAIERDVLAIETQQDFVEHLAGFSDPPPRQVRVYALKHPRLARQMATYLCEQVLSQQGSASIVGHTLVVADVLEQQSKIQYLINGFDGDEQPPDAGTPGP